ncbi:ABC transporter substrate-binding protein [Sinorhizobium meliloti]|uniref:ABC transporter substrate-binding protein n=1 Tax=Rhizobium meliloti TaxID=382 RepID=A0A2J0Z120_RHIML|nr:ABC transporter substrate-binding protein [Sinorhizobium meliloti]PJR14226.1 ABC transporter substrate-binding protein [Sinorhizobium meliloti]
MITRRVLLGAASAIALLSTSAPAFADVVKLGVLAPLTGPASADGQEVVNGAKLAAEELNAAGGVAGHTFAVVVADVGDGSPDKVATAVERLLGDPDMGGVFSAYASTTNFEIETMAEQDMVYLIGANSQQTQDIIAPAPDDFPTVWSLTPSYDAYNTEIVPVVEELVKAGKLQLPNRKVAIISSDNPYSKGIADGMTKAFEEAGWEISVNELVPFGEIGDWRAFLGKVRQDPPALLINTDYLPGNAATFMTQFMEKPTNSLVFIQYAPSVPEFLDLTKEKSSGVLYNLLGGMLLSPSNPRAQEVTDKYKAKFNLEPGTYGPLLYEEVMIYADALAKVKDPGQRKEIGLEIGRTDKQTGQGRTRFDPATHLAVQGGDGVPLQFFQIQDGKRVLFHPGKYATGEFVQPAWMK